MATTLLPYIPTFITVHLGSPSANAANVTVRFSDYVKNVASDTGTTYLDINSVLRQADGSLPEEASTGNGTLSSTGAVSGS